MRFALRKMPVAVAVVIVALLVALLIVSFDRHGGDDEQSPALVALPLFDMEIERLMQQRDLAMRSLSRRVPEATRPRTCGEERRRFEADRVLEHWELTIIKQLCGGFGNPATPLPGGDPAVPLP